MTCSQLIIIKYTWDIRQFFPFSWDQRWDKQKSSVLLASARSPLACCPLMYACKKKLACKVVLLDLHLWAGGFNFYEHHLHVRRFVRSGKSRISGLLTLEVGSTLRLIIDSAEQSLVSIELICGINARLNDFFLIEGNLLDGFPPLLFVGWTFLVWSISADFTPVNEWTKCII